MNLTVHKVIFVKPLGNGQFVEVCQRYFNPSESSIKFGKKREFPVSPADWVRQRGNRFLQYKDWDFIRQYGFYDVVNVVKPNGKVMQAVELMSAKGAEVARAVAQGGQLQAGLVLCVLCIAVGVFAGLLFGYFGLPVVTGQHLVSNPVGGSP